MFQLYDKGVIELILMNIYTRALFYRQPLPIFTNKSSIMLKYIELF